MKMMHEIPLTGFLSLFQSLCFANLLVAVRTFSILQGSTSILSKLNLIQGSQKQVFA